MNTEQQLIEKWRNLPSEQKQQVLQFVESLSQSNQPPTTALGERLRYLRAKIVANGEPLLNQEQIEKEVMNRRGGLQNINE